MPGGGRALRAAGGRHPGLTAPLRPPRAAGSPDMGVRLPRGVLVPAGPLESPFFP